MDAPNFQQLLQWGYEIYGLPYVDECGYTGLCHETKDTLVDDLDEVFLRADGIRVVQIDGEWYLNEGYMNMYSLFIGDAGLICANFKLRKIESK